MRQVKIYQPVKSAMQSGRANTRGWILEYELDSPRRPEPLMGWIAAEDTNNQVRLRFASLEQAQAFAEKHGWQATVVPPRERRIPPKSYMDNFR